MSNISIGNIWSEAWAAFKRNWLTGVGLYILLAIAGILVGLVALLSPPLISLVFLLGLIFFGLVLRAVYAQWGLRVADSEGTVSFGSAFPSSATTYLKVMGGYFAISIVVGIVSGTGSTILALAGLTKYVGYFGLIMIMFSIVLEAFLFLYPYCVVDRGESIFASLRKAFKLASRNLGKVIIYLFSAIGINFLGAILCGLGLPVTLPLTWIASAKLYRALAPTVES